MGLEPTSLSTGGFQDRFLTKSDDFRCVAQSTGDRNRTYDLLVQSQTQLPTAATPGRNARPSDVGSHFAEFGEKDSNLHRLIQSQAAYR